MQELGYNSAYTECIKFYSDFHSLKSGSGLLNPDCEYTDYQWYLARRKRALGSFDQWIRIDTLSP